MSEDKPKFKFTKENMARDVRPDHWWYKGFQLTEAQVREAMAHTRSNQEAARWLGITDKTWKKYAKMYFDEASGKSLFEIHKNEAGRGIPKNWSGTKWKESLDQVLALNQVVNPDRIAKLKDLLMRDGRMGYQCESCGYAEKRLTDMKAPLLIHFKNNDKTDWRIENLQWICYNCHFILLGDIFSNSMIKRIESTHITSETIREDIEKGFELDEFYYDHLRKLGLDGPGDVHFKPDDIVDYKDPDDGSEFIDIKK